MMVVKDVQVLIRDLTKNMIISVMLKQQKIMKMGRKLKHHLRELKWVAHFDRNTQ